MRVLLLLAPEPLDTPLADAIAHALEAVGATVTLAREVNPDLDGYDVVHVIATGPIEHAIRQGIHTRRWGRPLFVTPSDWPPLVAGEAHVPPPARYVRALRDLLVGCAARVITVHGGEESVESGGYVATVRLRVDDPEFGAALVRCYQAAREEQTTMQREGDPAAERWIPALSAEDYGKHLEDLVQLQLELIAYRDAEYEQLRQRLDAAQRAAPDQDLAAEYARLGAWSHDLAARHEALQADYARMQRWAGELESQLQGAGRGGRLARIAGLVRRR